MITLPDDLVDLYPDLWKLEGIALRHAVDQLLDPETESFATCPLYELSLFAMWDAECKLPVRLRRLYYRELLGPARRFDADHGNCLGDDAYEWTLVHASAEERAKAFVATHLIAKLKQLYDDGTEHRVILGLAELYRDQASEAGCGYEPDHDWEAWEEGCFAELFAPLNDPDETQTVRPPVVP